MAKAEKQFDLHPELPNGLGICNTGLLLKQKGRNEVENTSVAKVCLQRSETTFVTPPAGICLSSLSLQETQDRSLSENEGVGYQGRAGDISFMQPPTAGATVVLTVQNLTKRAIILPLTLQKLSMENK